MSTLPFSKGRCPDQESLVSFLYDEFDGSEASDRRTLTKHVESCERCARVLASLGGVRQRLQAWKAPETSPMAFRIASDASSRHHSGSIVAWAGWMKPAFPLAAAAAIVLGAALGLARLDVQYDRDGFRVRTGWGHDTAPAVASTVPNPRLDTASAGLPTVFLPPGQNPNRPVTQQDMQTLAQTLRQEIALTASRLQAQDTARSASSSTMSSASEVALLKRIEQLIDQSEVRQQRNLDLRISEASQNFDVQRRSDMAVIEQGYAKLQGQREVDAQQQRLLWNALRASQQIPVAPR